MPFFTDAKHSDIHSNTLTTNNAFIKGDLTVSGTITGTGDNTLASTEYVDNSIQNLISGASDAYDTLIEIQTEIESNDTDIVSFVNSTVKLTGEQTIAGSKTFSHEIVADANLRGNVTGNLTGNVTGDVTGNLTGDDLVINNTYRQGLATKASGQFSHAHGYYTTASGIASHAQGFATTASGNVSHAQGSNTSASGHFSHAKVLLLQLPVMFLTLKALILLLSLMLKLLSVLSTLTLLMFLM